MRDLGVRTALVGAVESTRVALEALGPGENGEMVIVTLPDEELGRHSDGVDLRPLAEGAGVPLHETTNVNSEATLSFLRAFGPDYVFVVGWSQICRREFLEIASQGTIGYHPSPLPENRGRAVIPWTILQGRDETGGTLFWMDEGMDTGDILIQECFAVSTIETATSLYEKHMDILRKMLTGTMEHIKNGDVPRRTQDHSQASYCSQRLPEDGWIGWDRPAYEIWTLIRAVTRPYPGAFTVLDGERLVIWNAELEEDAPFWGIPGQVQTVGDSGALVQCGDRGHVRLIEIQRSGAEAARASTVLKRQQRLGRQTT